jgi:hypothetical protein
VKWLTVKVIGLYIKRKLEISSGTETAVYRTAGGHKNSTGDISGVSTTK